MYRDDPLLVGLDPAERRAEESAMRYSDSHEDDPIVAAELRPVPMGVEVEPDYYDLKLREDFGR